MGIYVLCPYWKKEHKRSISCEDTIRSYPTQKDKQRWIKSYCTSSWKECPYAKRLEDIYSLDIPNHLIKEKIMKNKIEQQYKEINKLMRENGQLNKKVKLLEDRIEDRDRVAEKNHEMYMKSLKTKDSLLKAKGEQINWLESFAAAFMVLAFGENTREVRLSKGKVLKMMTGYKMEYEYDQKDDCFIIHYEKVTKGEE